MKFVNNSKIRKLMDKPLYLFFIGFFLTLLITSIVFAILGFTPKELSIGANGGITLESQDNTTLFGVDFTKGTNKLHKIKSISINDIPARIVISKIGLDAKIGNPESSDVKSLDIEISKNPVRYPGSGTIASGNMFIFGHSTGFKVVQNKAYKVFNDIKNLKEGDNIEITSMGGGVFVYKVTAVEKASKYDTYIDFSAKNQSLTLSTCDSFGSASDRYVVKAVRE